MEVQIKRVLSSTHKCNH